MNSIRATDTSALSLSRSVYYRLRAHSAAPPPRMRAWDGNDWGPTSARSTIVLQHPGALRALLLPPSDLTAGEAYVFDDVDIEGDIYETLRWAATLGTALPIRTRIRVMRDLRRLPGDARRSRAERPRLTGRLHTKQRDHDAVSHHYDTGNDFFELFLGDTMTYSCAYYLDPDEDLDVVQRRKLDVVCRKLALEPGDTLLDIGCGWGSLALHAATTYGATVTGVTVSAEQAGYARARAAQLGVTDRVTIIEGDYRDVEGPFDAIASVGMVEHVGRAKLTEYFSTIKRLLSPGGAFLNHGITTRSRHRRRRPTFVSTYVFPDGELVPIDERLMHAEQAGFEVRDVESLRMSYAGTLRAWVQNLEQRADEAVAVTNAQVFRIWRLYMAGSVISFEGGHIGVYQELLVDPTRPWLYGRRRLLAHDDH